ncbi:amino acid ABC transporter permease [Achromobacter marplatensis]|jgi:polar amino acid transport system permease protein|uniref:amino acid ABC transporter permease n=1 Tax=Achromobacter marplatensis TaxID=470868 RepID=UPI0028E5E0F0|nr:amino acid ABC transporter permease [Achromobacter marplatensis]
MIDLTLLGQLLPVFATAAGRTVALVAAGLAGGLVIGFLMHVLRETGVAALRWLYWSYTAVWRGVPFLIHLFIVYFGLPAAGISLDPFVAAAVTLSVYGGAYFAEIFRACWQTIPKGQIEAARCMGLTQRQVFLRIECPQALRASVPLIVNQTILLMKESALASVITYPELTMTAGKVVSEQFVYIEPYLLLALSYWALALLINRLGIVFKRCLAR